MRALTCDRFGPRIDAWHTGRSEAMSEQELWEWACPELGWKRLDPEERGYAGEVVETYLVCVKSETEFNLSDSQDPVAYVDQPRDVVCGLIPDLRGYADWEASAVWINVCIPKRP